MIHFEVLLYTVPPLLLLEAFFSGSEIALLSADKLVLHKRAKAGSRGAKLALDLARHPERVLSTTLLMTSFCVVSNAGLIALTFLSSGSEHAELWATLITSPMIVIFGELLPKTLFQRHATQWAPWIARPVIITYSVLLPFTKALSAYTARLARIITPIEELISGKKRSTREELVSLLSYSRRESEIKSSEKRIIRRILDFKDSEAKHALIPLVRVEALDEQATLRDALESFERHRHSRVPVYRERVDNVIGVLEAASLLSATSVGPTPELQRPISELVQPAHYVAETQSLEDVLGDMHRENREMVVVVDEHGGAIGVLTTEDIVEEIVGEISDEYDTESLPFKTLGESSWLIQASMEIAQLNEVLQLELPYGDYETLGGFLLQQFGRIPEERDELFFNTGAGHFKFTVRAATERQIESVLIERQNPDG